MRCLLPLAIAGCCPAAKPAVAIVPPPAPDAAPIAVAVPPTTPPGPPVARTVDVVDHEFGLDLPDPYRWMEGLENPERTAWLRAQGEHAAKYLAALPGREKLHARIRELGLGVTAVWGVQIASGRTIYARLAAGEQLPKLVARDADGKERVLVDPAKLGTGDSHAALGSYTLSPDGAYVSYVISMGGGEVGVLHVVDAATGAVLPDAIERIWGESDGSWLPDGKGFFYTQMGEARPGVDPMTGMIARLHVMGHPVTDDITVLGRDPGTTFPLAPDEWPGLWMAPDSTWMIVSVGGAHSDQRVAVAKLSELDRKGTSKTPWRIVAGYADSIESAFPHGDRLYMKTFKDAPNRKLISVPLAKPDLAKARIELAEDPDATMSHIDVARDAAYVLHMVNGRARFARWAWSGTPVPIALPLDGWIPDRATDVKRDGITFQIEDWTHPGAYYVFEPKTKQVKPIGLAWSSPADYSNVVATEVEVPSGGVQVPLSILHGKNVALDGSHPTLIYAYGAYGSSETPGFSAARLAWLERGGVIAVAHVRGGGEKGRRWQDDGSREKKMNGIADLVACAEYLVAQKYTSPQKIAIDGSSMGGIMVGRALTVRPDLFAAVWIGSGAVNPLRILAAENGANQKSELGDPATEAGYRALAEMDPYLHVKPGTAYPGVIFTIGVNDHRVAPWMAAKMAARLQASTTSKRPILVRVDVDAGHGIGSTRDQAYDERADAWSFMFEMFGDPELTPPHA